MVGSYKGVVAWIVGTAAALAAGTVAAQSAEVLDEVVVTARYRSESAQDVPIALSVIGEDKLEASGASTIVQATTLAPSTQFISSNPRNTSITIRGFGSAYGLTNDGLEPGVGIYIDQVYHPRPSAATFDMVDVERVEILRGPQGTLYGKNTTAGALNVSTRLPTFEPESQFELSAGDFGLAQAKAYFSGPLAEDTVAGKISLVSTQRDGTVFNGPTGRDINETHSLAVNGQLLFEPNDRLRLRLISEIQEQRANCCTQVFVRVGQTLRTPARQFDAMAAALGYVPPSRDPYDRVADINSGARADQRLGGLTAIADWKLASGTLTSVTAWRYWDWRPQNDRDYTNLSILTASVNPSDQRQASQELRFAGSVGERSDYIVGVYAFHQGIETNGLQGYGADAAYWLVNATVPRNLLDGYESRFVAHSSVDSAALFGQVNWHLTDRLTFTPGIRYTEDRKDAVYDQTTSGGLATTDPALINAKLGIVRPQFYAVDYSDGSASGQITLSFAATDDLMLYANLSDGYKSGGINLAGIPNDAAGNPSLISALVKPEEVNHVELGLKSQFLSRSLTVNLALFDTKVEEYQANVVDAGPGALRGYLANIDEVEVRGLEADLAWNPTDWFSGYFSAAWNDGEYESFANAPCPLELAGGPAVCDLSGRPLPALSDTVASLGGEYRHDRNLFGHPGQVFFGFDASYRSEWYSDASVSEYGLIDGYGLLNLRAGFRSNGPWEFAIWARNALDKDYLQFVSIQSGNSGLVIGTPGDPRIVGITAKARF
jgi:iron complex outermembrane recepter protein